MPLLYPLLLSCGLFGIGLYGVLARRHTVMMLLGVELMLNAVNLNLVAFDAWWRDPRHTGQSLTLFTIALAAAEIGLGLAIILSLFRATGSADVDQGGIGGIGAMPHSAEPIGAVLHGANPVDATDASENAGGDNDGAES